ncbi:MAG: hypothetical protein HQ501_02830 [Rhodospirillales bacterium]|nr:hypothetical protein [Rhodospirillales bacterium]
MADGEVKKPDWPQTPDGTIDWETVFENPETGIIPVLTSANTKEILHKGTVAVVKQLFTRKNDEAQVESFLKELNYILKETEGSEDLPAMQDSIINLLRRIKDGRVEKAAAYVALKKKEAATAAIYNRNKRKQARRSGEPQTKSATIIGLGVAAILMAIVVVLLIYVLFIAEDAPPSGDTEDSAGVIEYQPPSPPKPVVIEAPEIELSGDGYPLGMMDPETIAQLGPNVMILNRIFWSGQVEGGRARGIPLVPVLIITDVDIFSRICDFAPNLIDAINLALGRTITGDDKASPDDLREAGLVAMDMVNERLGNSWIRDIHLLYDVDARLLAMSGKCQLIE